MSPSASSFSPNGVSSASPPMRSTKSHTHRPAVLTSSRCAGSALTLGIARKSFSSLRQVSSMGRDSTQIVRTPTEDSRLVVGIEQPARLERETAAADARRQAIADRLQRLDPLVELAPPGVRELRPVALGRRLARRERVERSADAFEWDSGGLARLNEGDAAQRRTGIPALVALGALGGDEPLPLVEAEGRLRDAAAGRKLTDRQHLT